MKNNQMSKVTLYVGLNDKDDKIQYINTDKALAFVSDVCAKRVGGATISLCVGVYTHENGDVVQENTIKIELINVDEDMLLYLLKTFKHAFNQESIMVEHAIVDIDFQ